MLSYISSVFNKADYVIETLNNLRSQKGINTENAEFIFADDASNDHSVALLEAEASKDSRIKIIRNDVNAGPAVRINQAASAASGDYIIPVDSDDLLPENATSFMFNVADNKNAPLVFGRSKRWKNFDVPNPNIPLESRIKTYEDPLAACARKRIVHMGFLVHRDIWQKAGGADESIFIQDQSLPLRLSSVAVRMSYIDDVIYWLRPADADSLSNNIAQQHHDRFFSVLPLLEMPNISKSAKKFLMKQAISALWKERRDSDYTLPHASSEFINYMANKMFSKEISKQRLNHYASQLKHLPNIRRPQT